MAIIQEEKRFMKHIPDNLPGGIFVSRVSDHKIIYANSKLINMLGCDDYDDFIKYTGGVFNSVMYEEDRQRLEATLQQQEAFNKDGTAHIEYRILTKAGHIRYVQDFAFRGNDPDEGDLFYVFIVDLGRKLLAYDVDELTGLPKKHRFLAYAEQYQKICEHAGTSPAYIFLELSNFKMFNLNYGTEQGDILLKNISGILKEEFVNDFVARCSGDCFVVLTDSNQVVEHTKKVIARIDDLQKRANVYARAGIYCQVQPFICPTEGFGVVREACTTIKKESKEHIQVYTQEHVKHLRIRAFVTDHIDDAIENKEITVFYQPVVRTSRRTLCGFEALARWNSPVYGFLSPGDFITALESSNQIYKLDRHILEEICKTYQHRAKEGKIVVPVSFNLSRLDFQMCDIVRFVIETADQYQVPHAVLRVEITETTLASDDHVILDAIDKFHEAGFEV